MHSKYPLQTFYQLFDTIIWYNLQKIVKFSLVAFYKMYLLRVLNPRIFF